MLKGIRNFENFTFAVAFVCLFKTHNKSYYFFAIEELPKGNKDPKKTFQGQDWLVLVSLLWVLLKFFPLKSYSVQAFWISRQAFCPDHSIVATVFSCWCRLLILQSFLLCQRAEFAVLNLERQLIFWLLEEPCGQECPFGRSLSHVLPTKGVFPQWPTATFTDTSLKKFPKFPPFHVLISAPCVGLVLAGLSHEGRLFVSSK